MKNIENKDSYLEKLNELLLECFTDEDVHAIVIVGNERTHIMGMYAVNANTAQVGALVTAAATYCIEDAKADAERVVN